MRRLAPDPTYVFGPFRLDIGLSRLERNGQPIAIPPKAFDLLVLLVRNRDRVLSKKELMDALWPNTFVEEGNLTQHIYTLRKALGDRPDGTAMIESVPRRGYRLNADVRDEAGERASAVTVQEGERKRATVLHCTIAGAEELAERLGSVEMHRFVEGMIAAAETEVARYDGVITQTLPDGFVAIFGAREVHEDDARRAVLAALAVQRQVADAEPTDEERVAVSTGITSGPLVVNHVSGGAGAKYVAVGEPLRAVAILQQLSEPGAILVDDTTRRAIAADVRTEPVGHAGKAAAFRVIGLQPARSRRDTGRTLVTFVGRQREALVLEGLFAQALAGHGQAVSVVGEPGMGKSRLVFELTRGIADKAPTVAFLEGRCVSYGSLVPYLPLIDLLRGHCGVAETDTPESLQRAVEAAICDNDLPPDAGTWLLRLIGVVDDATARDALSPEAIKARTFDALRLLFLKAAERRPLVIVVEDVHWIDRTSEEFLTTLVGELVASRILLIATHRPGYRAPWMDRSYVTHIALAPLSAADSARVLESVRGDRAIDAGVSTAILERSEGNPFFLEELARAVLEQGNDAARIPDTVQGVIMARLDRLADVPKRLLQTASVIGREVPVRVLTRVWEGSARIDEDLRELCRQEFLYARPSADDPVYVFKHALTQDVAYDSLLARRRRDLHLAAARALEHVHAGRLDDIASALAYHYARTDLIDEAVTWLMRAADQAARVYANAEAILHLDLASRRLQRLPEGTERDRRMLEVALRHAHSLYFLGKFRDSVDVLTPHAARVARLNEPALAARYAFWLAHMFSRLGDQRRAADNAHRAIEAATAAGDSATLGKAHGLLALEGHWSGDTSAGIAHGNAAVEFLAPLVEQRWWLGMAHFYLAVNHLLTAAYELALDEAKRADAVGKEIGDPRLQTYAGYTTGWIELTRGNTDVAVTACRHSLTTAPDRVSRAYAALFLSFALIEHGEHDEARAHLERALVELEGFAFPQWHSLGLILMAEAHRRSGRLDDAAQFVEAGREIATRANYRYAIDLAARIAARIV